MPVKVAINGFGRIGRLVLRAIVESGRDDVVPVAINDLGSVEMNAHLFAHDSVHGRFPGQIEVSGGVTLDTASKDALGRGKNYLQPGLIFPFFFPNSSIIVLVKA
jgi:glyceraldehyde-3-phosphate dehydrogenase/erythrose-4-phosphate dehydrogenase